MARKIKEGLSYFPFDVDFFEDDKIQLIEAEFGIKGEIIIIKLLCKIYKENGYYYQWGDDQCLLFSKNVGAGIVPNLVDEVIKGLVKRSFFDEGVFNKFKILTSKGIQKRFFEAIERRKKVEIIQEIMLIDINVTFNLINVTFIPLNVNINSLNVNISTQSKVKESKGKESKAKDPEIIFPFLSADFLKIWDQWKIYRKNEFKKIYKTSQSEQAALSHLDKIAGGEEKNAMEIIMQSIANQWVGFFELKNNGKSINNSKQAGSKVDGEQLDQAFTKFYNEKK